MTDLVHSRVENIQKLAKAATAFPSVDLPVKHYFSDGVYVREIFMPKGSLVVGKIHKTRHLNIISKGSCKVVTPTRTIEIVAPYTFESYEGEVKAVIMHSDVVWSTVHVTEETDLEVIEEHTIAKEYDEELYAKLESSLRRLT